jgi:hypothetical protein
MVATLVVSSSSWGESRLRESVIWHDGDQVKHAWINPDLVAQVGELDTEKEIRAEFPGAERHMRKRKTRFRLWRLGTRPSAAARTLNSTQSRTKDVRVSEVFHERASGRSPIRTLPGGVVLYLPPGWTSARCEAWISEHGHQIVRRIGSVPNGFVVNSEPGVATIEAANRLHDTGEVVTATPDWAIDISTR